MFQAHGSSKQTCSLLAVLSGKISDREKPDLGDSRLFYPLPELVSSGRLEIRTLNNPTVDEFRQVFQSWNPNFVYLQGEQLLNEEEVGPLVWGGVNLSTPEAILRLFGPIYPTSVYLEVPNGGNLAEVLHSKGVPYVIYWKNSFLSYAASHFRQALFSVVQSSCTHTWDAFQVAHASFRLYCGWTNHALSKSQRISGKISPCLLGEAPKTIITLPEKDMSDEEALPGALPAIKIYDDDVDMKFLICGVPCTLDACLLGSLEDGLNALLRIEMRGSKLHNRVSAPPPPLQAGTFSRGVVTMKCDLSTCSSAHISILVSGSAQTCFDDQLLEDHIKNELTEKSQLVRMLPNCEERNASFPEPRKSVSIACGATVVEVCMKVPRWASQVLRQLAPEVSYRSFVALGIACIQGTSVASFEKADADCLLFFYRRQGKDHNTENFVPCVLPSWYKVPDPCRKRFKLSLETKLVMDQNRVHSPKRDQDKDKETGIMEARQMLWVPVRPKRKIAAMRPVPHTRKQKHNMLPFSGAPEVDIHDAGKGKANLPIFTTANKSPVEYTPISNRKALSSSYQTHQIISLNPLPLKKHGCGRCPIQVCSEEEFLMDVMEFLILRGHSRLVPPGGLAEFPDAILNAKRLDLYNLYKEVVSRGGFHVGNGINWKGQVFSKMRNHTVTNRMTGVGNTLKRHYETYLLEYELAHDDVDGECCLLCHSSSAGDWVNCGMCGEWAHFGCDRRQGLGAFKDYAKTDGLEYICPHCSLTGFRIKSQRSTYGC